MDERYERRQGMKEIEAEVRALKESQAKLIDEFMRHDAWEQTWRKDVEQLLTNYKAIRLSLMFVFAISGALGGVVTFWGTVKDHWK